MLPAQIRAWWRELPWQLRPWSHARMLQTWVASAQARADRLQLANSALVRRNEELDRRVTQLHRPLDASPAGLLIERNFGYEAPGTDKPAFVLVAADRGNGRGTRIYASSTLSAFSLSMTGQDDPPPRFKLRVTFGETLVIDKPSYGQGISHWQEIMRNRENPPLDSPR